MKDAICPHVRAVAGVIGLECSRDGNRWRRLRTAATRDGDLGAADVELRMLSI